MIWIIGNKGLLGREVSYYLAEKGYPIVGTDKEVSILSPLAMERHIEAFRPKWIINCAGYKDIKKAEETWEKAFMINKSGAAMVASLAAQYKVPLIHISTGEVFDGSLKKPLTERITPHPLNVYGASKLAGEDAVRGITRKHFIIRTSWLYGEYGPNYIYDMLTCSNQDPSSWFYHNRVGNPTWTRDVASLIAAIIGKSSQDYGIYHYSSRGECSNWELVKTIFQYAAHEGLVNNLGRIIPDILSDEIEKVKRPSYTVLSKEKVMKKLAPRIPDWEESLYSFLSGLKPANLENYTLRNRTGCLAITS